MTIAELLKQPGYATGCYGKWGLDPKGIPTNRASTSSSATSPARAHNFTHPHLEERSTAGVRHAYGQKIAEPLDTDATSRAVVKGPSAT